MIEQVCYIEKEQRAATTFSVDPGAAAPQPAEARGRQTVVGAVRAWPTAAALRQVRQRCSKCGPDATPAVTVTAKQRRHHVCLSFVAVP
jgi:hypothetical protein